jgi:hypothetical protein
MARKVVELVNIFPGTVKFQIDGMPGTEGVEYEIEEGKSIHLDENYCKPVPGAGLNALPSIIARLTMRTWPDSEVRASAMVPATDVKKEVADVKRKLAAEKEERAKAARKAAAALAAAGAQS